ncbi:MULTISPECIES: LLM class flavin-dependent oxidoreductase [unclassified Pseudonocardia]|uniref:LLM class flavin-dependent oxidoreductase n=1 Tax=unclassified Pseudonocardia TaxID=2619320 RepID=UPI0001FFF019|nr:LLM class flavin-dependent oxidoreductase [Pseudonocardia sp. Ae707_Ps1]OLM19331.1 putative monooxygenase [Pseudonocardia sp. Ae707_Ps1]
MTSTHETPARTGPAFGLWYDFRNPDPGRPFGAFYAEVLDQISWAEQRGLDSVWLTEHHFCDDGYSPSPFVLGSAIAQRTSRMRIGTNLIVSPLHDPVRLAEDASTLSLLSGGRFDLGVGQGYWAREFDAFGRTLTHRPSLLEEGVELIRHAWSGSAEGYRGRRYTLPPLPVTPVPETPPQLLVGAMADVAIERAARIADGFLSTQNAHHRSYLDAVQRLGRPVDDAAIYAGQWAIVADDPERVWSRIGEHALYQLNEYISWGAFGPPESTPRFTDPAQIIEAGAYQLMDAEAATTHFTELLRGTPQIRDVHFWAMLPGEPVESGSERIAYLSDKVVPAVRERLRARP